MIIRLNKSSLKERLLGQVCFECEKPTRTFYALSNIHTTSYPKIHKLSGGMIYYCPEHRQMSLFNLAEDKL